MKKIILMRHAKSSWKNDNLSDHDRPLTRKGIKASKVIGKYLESNNIIPDLIICSTAKRAKKTIESVLKKNQNTINIEFRESIYNAEGEDLLKLIYNCPENINKLMLVGHNPTMELLVQKLIRKPFIQKFSTAAIAVIEFSVDSWKDIKNTDGNLLTFITPKMLV